MNYILTGLSLFAAILTAGAQSGDSGVATNKSVSAPDEKGEYTITLETWATGQQSYVVTSAPADIVLVLDLSQSMTQNYNSGYAYTGTTQDWTYNGVQNNNRYYKHTDGEYYQVTRRTQGNRPRYYRLSVDINGTRYYLTANGLTTTAPTNVTSNTVTIWTGTLYTRTTQNRSRLEALQDAVEDFVEVIYHNDNYEDNTDTKPRSEPLGNRISIVTFGGPRNNTNVTRVNSGLTNVTNANGAKNTAMISDLLALTNNSINNGDHYGTYADEGMVLANGVLNGISAERKENSSRTVVLFTDGAPGEGPGWTTGNGATNSIPTANRAITAALTAKTTHTSTVFTVILGDIANNDMRNYLDYTSSNYPSAQSMTNPGQPGEGTSPAGGPTDYSLEAGNDLSGVFTTIAHASGGASATVGSQTQVRDVVSSSFALPIDTESMTEAELNAWIAANVHVYTSAISSDGDTWGTQVPYNDAVIAVNSATNLVSVEGFDYSADDNWVGIRYNSQGNPYSAGKKLVIQFNIVANEDATGGVGTNTNTSDSGVYIYDPKTNTYSCIQHYDIPHTTLPVNIRVSKTGLRSGESATFEVQRTRPLGWNDEGTTIEEKMANVQYNALGKPKPDEEWVDPEDTSDDPEKGFRTFSKVVVTNKGENGATVIKNLLALDPNWVYKLLEDDWGWAYTMEGSGSSMTTSDVQENPFNFTNREKTDALKHAEAVTINHFAGTHTEAHEEHYKSSKVEHF